VYLSRGPMTLPTGAFTIGRDDGATLPHVDVVSKWQTRSYQYNFDLRQRNRTLRPQWIVMAQGLEAF